MHSNIFCSIKYLIIVCEVICKEGLASSFDAGNNIERRLTFELASNIMMHVGERNTSLRFSRDSEANVSESL